MKSDTDKTKPPRESVGWLLLGAVSVIAAGVGKLALARYISNRRG